MNDPTGASLKAMAKNLNVSVDYLLGVTDDPTFQIREPSLNDDEHTLVETFRHEGWSGVARLSVEKVTR